MRKKYYLIHLSAILDGRIFILIKNGIIDGIPLISEEDAKNLPDDMKKKIEKIKIIKGNIFNVSRKIKCKVFICNDKETELKLKSIRVDVVDLSILSVLCRKPLKLGDVIDVQIYNNKNRIFLDDGTEVFIEEVLPEGRFKCRITGILETNDSRKINCEVIR